MFKLFKWYKYPVFCSLWHYIDVVERVSVFSTTWY